MDLPQRPRRNRRTAAIRNLVAEVSLRPSQMVLPLFLVEGDESQKIKIPAMPGVYRHSISSAAEQIQQALDLGIASFALFPVISQELKTHDAAEAFNPEGLIPRAIKTIKAQFPKATLITDVALDPYSLDGHDGLVKNGEVLNDESLEVLAKMALVQGQAGSDMVAPSDMMDGRVGLIRKTLDENGLSQTGILAYSAKYASSFYGPFRSALDSAPKAGDKKTYQMDFRNAQEALKEVSLDIKEGADIVMVKPALSYLDVIKAVKEFSLVPVAAYNVSGEYSMIKVSAEAGLIDETSAMVECLYSIRRAGADIIFTYFAIDMAKWLNENA